MSTNNGHSTILGQRPWRRGQRGHWKWRVRRINIAIGRAFELALRAGTKLAKRPRTPSVVRKPGGRRTSIHSSELLSPHLLAEMDELPDDLSYSSVSSVVSLSNEEISKPPSNEESPYDPRQDPNIISWSGNSRVSSDHQVEANDELKSSLPVGSIDRNSRWSAGKYVGSFSQGTRGLFVSSELSPNAPTDDIGRSKLFRQPDRLKNPVIRVPKPKQTAESSLEHDLKDLSIAETSLRQAQGSGRSEGRLIEVGGIVEIRFFDCRTLQVNSESMINPSLAELVAQTRVFLHEFSRSSSSEGSLVASVGIHGDMHLHYPDCAGSEPFLFANTSKSRRARVIADWERILQEHHRMCDGLVLWIGIGPGDCDNDCACG